MAAAKGACRSMARPAATVAATASKPTVRRVAPTNAACPVGSRNAAAARICERRTRAVDVAIRATVVLVQRWAGWRVPPFPLEVLAQRRRTAADGLGSARLATRDVMARMFSRTQQTISRTQQTISRTHRTISRTHRTISRTGRIICRRHPSTSLIHCGHPARSRSTASGRTDLPYL